MMSTANALPRLISRPSNDLVAGVAVFLVALPLCLGIALASDAPLTAGLIAGILGGILVGAISGSHSSVSGPAAGLTAVVASQIALLGSFEAFLAALTIAGLIQIGLGLLRVGFIAKFFPSSVIRGLLAAIGIILVLKQLPHLVGWDIDADGEMAFRQMDHENTFSEIIKMFYHIHFGAMLIGLLSLILLLNWDKVTWLKKTRLPSSLVVVALGMVAATILPMINQDWIIGVGHRVQVPVAYDLFSFLEFFKTPHLKDFLSPAVYMAGLTLALVGSLETLLNLEAVDKIDPHQRTSPPNRELIAQGIGNTLLGLVGGIPVTSVIIRSSVNINAGAKTKLSAIFHGVLFLFCVILIPSWLNIIPLSCLAAILIATGLKLASRKVVVQMWQGGMNQFLPFIITITAIIFTDLLVGVVVGLLASICFIFYSNLRRPLQIVLENHFAKDIQRVVLANQVSFLNRAALAQMFKGIPQGGHILIDASQADYIDTDILNLIRDFMSETAPAHNIKVSIVGFRDEHRIKNVIRYTEYATLQIQQEMTPAQVWQILKDGNERVLSGKRLQRDLGRQIIATSAGQFPLGVVLSCMDSRAPVELIFDLGIGDIFSVRMAGNTVSNHVLGSLEFACAIAGAKLIVVMGHTHCGAVGAAIDFLEARASAKESTGCDHLQAIIDDIQKVIHQKADGIIPPKGSSARDELEQHVLRAHVNACIHSIVSNSNTLKNLIDHGIVDIAGAVYDIKTGATHFVSPPKTSLKKNEAPAAVASMLKERLPAL